MKRTVLLLALFVVAGCGSGATKYSGPPLPRALAQRWAQRADTIAAADACSEQQQAVALRTDVILAVNKRKIPEHWLEPLTSKVNALAAHQACTPVKREARDLAGWLRDSSG
jgi:hypothetical protein